MALEQLRGRAFAALGGQAFYGWTIVAVAGLAIFVSGPGQSHNFSAFVEPISRDLGLSKSAIAIAYGTATLVAAFLLPYMGRLVDRHGPRRMLLVISALLGLACALFGAASGLVALALGFGVLRFLAQGSLMMNAANLVGQWFSRKRGFAASLMALGFALSMAVHPPLGSWLIETVGWRWAWVVLGLLTWIMMLPVVWLLVYDRPEDKGLLPDGEQAREGIVSQPSVDGLSLAESLRTPTFYLVTAGWFGISMLVTVLHFYQVTILTRQGIAPATAAQAFTLSAVTMAFAMPLVGRAFDRFRTRYVFAAGLLVTAISLNAITLVSATPSLLAYAIIFGINNAFSMTMFGYIMPRYFGRRHLGSIQGAGQTIGVVGASIGPLPVGLAFDYLGSTDGVLRLLAIYPVACALLAVLFLRTPHGVTHDREIE